MNPSRNNPSQKSNSQGNNFSQYNTNFFNTSQSYADNKINEEQDEYLLEDSVDQATGQVFSRKTPFKQNSNPAFNNNSQNDQPIQYQGYPNSQSDSQSNYGHQAQNTSIYPSHQNFFATQSQSQSSLGFNQAYPNQQYSQTFSQPQTRIQNKNALSRASKIDQSLTLIFRQHQKQPENAPGSKAASKIEEKSKKAVSRLSFQFFGKSGNPEENMKSKKKTRQTVAAFGKDYLPSNNEESSLDQEKNIFQRPFITGSQAEKTEIEHMPSKIYNEPQIKTSPQNQQKESLGLVAPQNRMSEVKRKRQRLSSGIEGLANLLKNFGSEKKEKKAESPLKSQPASRQANRVTMDMNSLISFLQSNDNQINKPSGQSEKVPAPSIFPIEKQKEPTQRQYPNQISENIRHLTEYVKPSMRVSENIIFEDQEEDQITPLKSPLRQKSIQCAQSIKKLDPSFLKQGSKSLQDFALESERKMIPNVSKDFYTRQVFNRYFCNLNERIHQQKQQYEQLIRQKAQIVKDINHKLSEYNIDAQKLAQWREQEQKIRQKIYSIKQKVSKPSFDKYSQMIHKFQLTFGIQLHRLQKTQLDDGFYIEFTYDDLLFRVHRSNKLNETKCKFLERIVLKKTKKDFEFKIQQKTDLIQSFINKKLKHIKNLTQFMIQLIRYFKALEKLELTMAHYAYINNNVKDFILREKSSEMEFTFTTGSKFDFLFNVDLMELMENGGMKIHRASDGKNIEVPDEFLKFQNGNKIGKCFIFLERNVAQSVMKEIENVAKTK